MPTDHTFLGGLKPMARVLGQHQDDQNAWDQHLAPEVVVILDRQGKTRCSDCNSSDEDALSWTASRGDRVTDRSWTLPLAIMIRSTLSTSMV